MSDRHTYPGAGVLISLLHICDAAELARVEADLTALAAVLRRITARSSDERSIPATALP